MRSGVGCGESLVGTVNAVVHATYIVPTSDSPQPTPLRIDDPQPKDCTVT